MTKYEYSTRKRKMSLCAEVGHDMIATTATNFRVCSRSKCRYAEILRNGEWEYCPRRKPGLNTSVSHSQETLF